MQTKATDAMADRPSVCYCDDVSVREAKRASARRAEIISTAREIFITKGYESTTVAAIIEAVGIAKGGFYHHFASKEAVFVACVDELATELATAFVGALRDDSLSPRQRVDSFLRRGYDMDEGSHRRAIAGELHAHGDHAMHSRVIDRVQHAVVASLADVITEGRDDGSFSVDGEPMVAAVAVVGTLRALHEQYAHTVDPLDHVPLALTISLVERMLGVH